MLRWPSAIVCLALAACGGPPPPADALIPIDASRDASIDAPSCPTDTSCPCFTNYDCPVGYACVSADSSGTMVTCIPGTRGTGVLGTVCTGEADCASALCVDGENGDLRCSDLCDSAANCTPELPRCLFIATFGVSICAPS